MDALVLHAPDADRVRANTWPEINAAVDRGTQLNVRRAAGGGEAISERLAELDAEWDFDRVLETEAATMGLVGLAAGLAVDRRLLVLHATVSLMLLIHATHGWYPLLPLFRRIGVRSRDEIERERYALKILRGDFENLPPEGSPAAERAAAAWKAVCA